MLKFFAILLYFLCSAAPYRGCDAVLTAEVCEIAILDGDLGVLYEGGGGAGDGGKSEDLGGSVDADILQGGSGI